MALDDDGEIGRRYRYDDGRETIEGVLVDVNYRPVHLQDDVGPEAGKIPSFWTIDLTGRWDISKAFQLYGSITNLTDKVAPLDPTTYGGINYNPMDGSGAMGRYYRIGLKYTFK